MTRMLCQIAILFGLLLTAGMTAGDESVPPPVRYEVELIVFRHVDQDRNTAEIPAASSIFRRSPLDLPLDVAIGEPTEPSPAPDTSGAVPDQADRVERKLVYADFMPLGDDAHTLNPLYQHLTRVDAYQPIVHVGWTQPVHSADDAIPYRFESVTFGDTDITGTVTLYKGRFLHLELDLALDAQQPTPVTRFSFGADTGESQEPYKLTESRRMMGSAAHYFDHPQFGVIARIAVVETNLAASGAEEVAQQ